MTDFTINVDTHPMAKSIDGITGNVKAVGGAVTAMQVAVIASERKAAHDICESIDSGFYLLMRSRISQRLAEFSSIMNSRIGQMTETAAAIDRTHQQMLGDFNRIKSRYVKLFDRLDSNLEDRVKELDREAMGLAEKRSSLLIESQCREAPAALYCASDTQTVALKATSARVKSRVRESIGKLGTGAHNIVNHAATLEHILDETPVDETEGTSILSVPVVYASRESLTVPDAYTTVVMIPTGLSEDAREQIEGEVRSREDRLASTDSQQLSIIRTRFIDKLNKSKLSDRVAETMMELFNDSFGSAAVGVSQGYANRASARTSADNTGGGAS